MATVRDAVASFGLDIRDGEELVVIEATGGKWRHYPVGANPDRPLSPSSQWYIAGGGYRPGSVQRDSGRTRDNLVSARLLSFDFDLSDLLDEPSDDVYGWNDDEILSYEEVHVRAVEDVAGRIGLPIHILAHTGHGLVAVVRIADADPDALQAVLEAYKAIAGRINAEAGMRLADPAVTDAGTRLIRIPGTMNLKGRNPRPVRLLRSNDGTITVEQLVAIAGTKAAKRRTDLRIVPNATDKDLQPEQADRIAAALVPLWVEGDRNNLSLAVAGEAAKAGVSEESCLALMERLCADGDDDETPARMVNVRRSYRLHAGGSAISGWMRLRSIVPAAVADIVDQTFDEVRQSQAVKLRVGTRIATPTPGERVDRFEASFSVTPLPDEVWYGWFCDYRDLMVPTTEAAPAFHLASALVVAAGSIGRRIKLDVGKGIYGNLYAVILGPSGSSRKDSAISRAVEMPNAGPPSAVPFQISRDVASAEALVRILRDQPNQILYLTEINGLLVQAQRKGTRNLLDKLIEAWDSPVVLQNASIRSMTEKAHEAVHPFLSIIAAGQPGRFGDIITAEDLHSGFANRWLYVPGVGGDPIPVEGQPDANAVYTLYRRLRQAIGSYQRGDAVAAIGLSEEAGRINAEWYAAIRRTMGRDEAEDSMRQRHQAIAYKIALIYAVSDESPTVEAWHLQAAIALVEWSWANVRRYMRTWGVSVPHKVERRILDVLETRGPLTRRHLQQQCTNRAWTAREFGQTLDSLIRNDVVVIAGSLIGLPDDDDV